MKVSHARRVLSDCKHALNMLQEESQPDSFRVLWVAGVALVRAVGHVLDKVDSEQDSAVKVAVNKAYESLKADKLGNTIFWNFIDEERNQVLKQYELGFFADPIDIVVDGQLHTLDEHLFCPLKYGSFAGEDCRDILEQAIEWWEQHLTAVENDAREVGND